MKSKGILDIVFPLGQHTMDSHLRSHPGPIPPHWKSIESWIGLSKVSNLHRHIAGSLSPEFLAEQYKENSSALQAFQKRYKLDPTQPDNIRSVISHSILHVEDGWECFEDAFLPSRFLLDNDPHFTFHHRSFQQATADSLARSMGRVGIRATLGCHWRSPADFKSLLSVAVQGILDGETMAGGQGKGMLILSLRKDISPDAAWNALTNFLQVRQEWLNINPSFAEKLYGLDSIGPEGSYDPVSHVPMFTAASKGGLRLFHHMGEIWEDGGLFPKLQQIQSLLEDLDISYLTNPVALMVNYETLSERMYSRNTIQNLIHLRQQLLHEIANKGIILEISPTSNDVLTRKKRKSEGWQFMHLGDIMREGVHISVTDDDGCIFDTDLLGEYLKLYSGTTVYGSMSLDEIKDLITGEQRVRQRF